MKQKFFVRLSAVLLALIMGLGIMAPAAVFASSNPGIQSTIESGGMVLTKTATLEDNGTYTINLEAYATGETQTTTEKSGIPLDIVLVIDQSGSMSNKLKNLKDSVTSFVNKISANAKEYNVNHRIAIAGFASRYDSSSRWANTGLFVNGSLINYQTPGTTSQGTKLTSQDYKDALVSVNDGQGNVARSITTAIGNFKANGATYTSYGVEMANKVFENNEKQQITKPDDGETVESRRIVVVFTDGEPGRSGYEAAEAGRAVNNAYDTKNTYGASVYAIGLYSNPSDNVTNFMNYMSSNYPQARQITNSSGWNTTYTWQPGNKASDKYYMTTANTAELENIFTNISQDIVNPSTEVPLTGAAVLKDIIGDAFILPDGYKATDNITVKTIEGRKANVEADISWAAENVVWPKAGSDINVEVVGKDINVTGFNYSNEYIEVNHPGKKLCVTIRGILPTDAAVTNAAVDTNNAASGIYESASAENVFVPFPQPKTILKSKVYVMDYAKNAVLENAFSDYNDGSDVKAVVDSFKAVNGGERDLNSAHGTAAIDESNVTYEPKTSLFDDVDSFYVFGKTTDPNVTDPNVAGVDANKNGNLWTRVSIVPANNVYFEDSFITEGSGDAVTRTGIVYSDGDWEEVSEGGNPHANTIALHLENVGAYGWENSLNDDAAYSDGAAHMATAGNGKVPSFTFTFKGTGVDIYSRTDSTTGTVLATLRRINSDGSKTVVQDLIVDNLSSSGTYYQIPSVFFDCEEYGKYEVTVKVTAAAGTRLNYYLDGIRVYNPLGNPVKDSIAYNAYQADNELNAVFTEVRDMLIDAGTFKPTEGNDVAGVVFIDEITDEDGHVTSDIRTYEDYGPKNEVYLAANQSIAFKVNNAADNHYYIGLKAPNGATSASVNGKTTINITAASDLYYEITPGADGYVVIRNTGSELLSITKLRTTNPNTATTGLMMFSLSAMLDYVNELDEQPVVEPTEQPTEAPTEEPTEEPTAVPTEEPIIVPSDAPTAIPTAAPTAVPTAEPTPAPGHGSIWGSIFDWIRNWFGGGR